MFVHILHSNYIHLYCKVDFLIFGYRISQYIYVYNYDLIIIVAAHNF